MVNSRGLPDEPVRQNHNEQQSNDGPFDSIMNGIQSHSNNNPLHTPTPTPIPSQAPHSTRRGSHTDIANGTGNGTSSSSSSIGSDMMYQTFPSYGNNGGNGVGPGSGSNRGHSSLRHQLSNGSSGSHQQGSSTGLSSGYNHQNPSSFQQSSTSPDRTIPSPSTNHTSSYIFPNANRPTGNQDQYQVYPHHQPTGYPTFSDIPINHNQGRNQMGNPTYSQSNGKSLLHHSNPGSHSNPMTNNHDHETLQQQQQSMSINGMAPRPSLLAPSSSSEQSPSFASSSYTSNSTSNPGSRKSSLTESPSQSYGANGNNLVGNGGNSNSQIQLQDISSGSSASIGGGSVKAYDFATRHGITSTNNPNPLNSVGTATETELGKGKQANGGFLLKSPEESRRGSSTTMTDGGTSSDVSRKTELSVLDERKDCLDGGKGVEVLNTITSRGKVGNGNPAAGGGHTEKDEDEKASMIPKGNGNGNVNEEENENGNGKIDHRKRKRNRTIQSCLPCHQNKRKVS